MIVARRPTKTIIAFRIKRESNPPLGPGDCRGRFYLRSFPHDWGLSPGHLVPSRGWGGGVDGTCKTYAIRFA
jgi:hypothetical protein